MDEHVGNHGSDVLRYRPHVVRHRKVARLSLLRHHVCDVKEMGPAKSAGASLTPPPSRAGMVLVNRLPGQARSCRPRSTR